MGRGVRKAHPQRSQVDPPPEGGRERWANQGVGEHGDSPGGSKRSRVSSTEVITESLQLSNTGFFQSLADKRRLGQWSIDIECLGSYCEGH